MNASGRPVSLTDAQFDAIQKRKPAAMKHIEAYLKERLGAADPAVMAAFEAVPREYFHYIYSEHRATPGDAYEDDPKPWGLGYGSALSDYLGQAYMTQVCKPQPGDVTLEIGTGSGFQSALLSRIVKQAYSIEIIEPLGKAVSQIFAPLGYDNVHTRVGDGYYGWPEVQGGFDIIIVTCAAQYAPPDLFKQMKPGGRLVIPIGQPFKRGQVLYVYTKDARGQDPLEARHGRVLHSHDRRDFQDAGAAWGGGDADRAGGETGERLRQPLCANICSDVRRRVVQAGGIEAHALTGHRAPSVGRSRPAGQERSDRRVRLERRQFLLGRQLRPVAHGVHHAEEAERLAVGGAELVPGQDGIVTRSNGFTCAHVLADQALAVAAQDHHRVHVFVALERRIAAGRHLEIAQFAAEFRLGEQHLARDRLERRRAVVLVGQAGDLVPAVVMERAELGLLFDIHVHHR